MSRRDALVLLATLCVVFVAWFAISALIGRRDRLATTAAPPQTPRGSATIAGTVFAGSARAVAKLEIYYRCSLAEVGIEIGDVRWMFHTLREARAGLEPVAVVYTTHRGTFEVGALAPGGYLILGRGQAGYGSRPVLVPGPRARVDGSLHLDPQRESLELTFRCHDGLPWSGQIAVQQVADDQRHLDFSKSWFGNTSAPIRVPSTGRVEISGLRSTTTSILALDCAAQRIVSRSLSLPHEGGFAYVLPKMPMTARGRILEGGAPLPNVSVWSTRRGDDYQLTLLAETDAEGRFAAVIPAGIGSVLVDVGHGDVKNYLWDPSSAPDVLVETGAKAAGVVSDNRGKPVPDGTVGAILLGSSSRAGIPMPAPTEQDGSFRIGKIAVGEAMILVQGDRWVSVDLAEIRWDGYNPLAIEMPSSASRPFALVAEPAASIAGTVRDAGGHAVVGCVVSCAPEAFRLWPRAQRRTLERKVITDTNGRFRVRGLIARAAYRVSVSSVGRAPHNAGIAVAEVGNAMSVDVQLPESRWVTVVVRDESSQRAVPQARVRVRVSEPGDRLSPRRLAGEWPVGGDGAVLAGPLPPGRAWVEVRAPEYIRSELERVSNGASRLEVTLKRGHSVEGHVAWANGDIAAGAHVLLETYSPGRDHGDSIRIADRNGRFRFAGLLQRTYDFRVFALKDNRVAEASVEAEGGRTSVKVVLEEPRASHEAAAVEVVIVDPSGARVPSASGIYRNGAGASYLWTVQDGVLQLGHAVPGAVVEVWSARDERHKRLPYGPASLVLAKELMDTQLRIQLPHESLVTGVVLDPDGTGVKGVLVLALLPQVGVEVARGRTDSEGRFVLRGLKPSSYALEFRTPSKYLPVADRQVPGGTMNVEVRLTLGRSATITVLGPEGRPLAGAHVLLNASRVEINQRDGAPAKTILWEPVASATTDRHGAVSLTGLEADRELMLVIQPPRGRRDLRQLELTSWELRDATLRLERVRVR